MQTLAKYITGKQLIIKKNDKNITDAVLQSLSGMEEIDINGLSEITNIDFIRNCPDLTFLSISQCEKLQNFNSVKDVCLEKLERLVIKQLINFDDNQDFIIAQKNLVYLKLEGVLVRGLRSLGQLERLREVNLDHNMEIDCDDLLVEQQNYQKLSMENCIYINLQMDATTLNKCTELDFRKNKIKAIQSSTDMAVTKMILTLNLCIDILTPERFKNLTTLIANNCTLTSLSLVRRLTSLTHLDVSTNSILKLTDLENLKDLKQLVMLNICDNPVNKLYKFTQQLGKNIPESIQCIYYVNERDNLVNKVLSYKIDIPTLIGQLQAKYAVYAGYRRDMEALYRKSRQLLNNINCAIITVRPFLVEFKRRQELINQQASVLPSYRTYSTRFRSDYFIKRYQAAKRINEKSINAFFLANQGKESLTQRQKVELQKICDAAGPCLFYILATRKYKGIEEPFAKDFTHECGSVMCKNAEGYESLKDCPERALSAVHILQRLYNEKKIVVVEKTDAELEAERQAELEREMLINPELAIQLAANYKKLKIEAPPGTAQGSSRPPLPSNRATPRQVVKMPTLKRPGSAASQTSNATSLYSDFSFGKAAYVGK